MSSALYADLGPVESWLDPVAMVFCPWVVITQLYDACFVLGLKLPSTMIVSEPLQIASRISGRHARPVILLICLAKVDIVAISLGGAGGIVPVLKFTWILVGLGAVMGMAVAGTSDVGSISLAGLVLERSNSGLVDALVRVRCGGKICCTMLMDPPCPCRYSLAVFG